MVIVNLHRASLPVVGPNPGQGIDYELFLDCVHCGLCTATCPTYLETGNENDSPRGRIYLMRSVTDGRIKLNDTVRAHLDLCLDCRACETACPSGVQYGRLIEPFRLNLAKLDPAPKKLSWLNKLALFQLTPYAARMRWALAPARIMQASGLDWLLRKSRLLRLFPKSIQQMHAMLPRLGRPHGRLPEHNPAHGTKRAKVALFTGCAGDAFYPQTTVATLRVLQHNGCEVWIPPNQACCGALHFHAADEDSASRFARENLTAFKSGSNDVASQVDAVIVNAAGCGAFLKDYGHFFHNDPDASSAKKFASKVKDVSEFLMELGPLKPTHPIPLKAAYHDACHLCHGQQIRRQPRELLKLIPGLDLVPLEESEICCGAAGSYNITQPEMADRLGKRKAWFIQQTGAQALFTANVGCLLQITRNLKSEGADLWVAHPIDALWASYTGNLPTLITPTR